MSIPGERATLAEVLGQSEQLIRGTKRAGMAGSRPRVWAGG